MSCALPTPWSADIQTSSDANIQRHAKAVTDGLSALPYLQNLASLGIASGAANLTSTKSSIEAALANIQNDTNARSTCAETLIQNNQSNRTTTALNETIGHLKPIVDQQKTIYQLRQEQATSLANKYASNAYSSWWGLWSPMGDAKPLGDVTRTTLYLFTVASVAYIAFGGRKRTVSSSSSIRDESNNQMGGSRKIRR